MKTKSLLFWRLSVAVLASTALLFTAVGAEAKTKSHAHKVASVGKHHKQTLVLKSSRKLSHKLSLRQQRRILASQHGRVSRYARAQSPRLQRVNWVPSDTAADSFQLDGPSLIANTALAYNETTGAIDFGKNTEHVVSIASITKLMTVMVILDAKLDLDEVIQMTQDDVIASQGSRSRLQVGYGLTRAELIKVAMLVSDNRAAVALARTYPGGIEAFVDRMNRKARSLGMTQSRFVEPSGLDPENSASPTDIVRMVQAAYEYPLMRTISATAEEEILPLGREEPIVFRNTNQLVRDPAWEIGISKTGFIGKAGHCLVMHTKIANVPYVLVVMDSSGNRTREADAARIKRWLEYKAGVHSSSS